MCLKGGSFLQAPWDGLESRPGVVQQAQNSSEGIRGSSNVTLSLLFITKDKAESCLTGSARDWQGDLMAPRAVKRNKTFRVNFMLLCSSGKVHTAQVQQGQQHGSLPRGASTKSKRGIQSPWPGPGGRAIIIRRLRPRQVDRNLFRLRAPTRKCQRFTSTHFWTNKK